MPEYDALLFVSFGGPEGPDDVMPFLENVLRGRNVPRERMLEVAEHYQHFGGVSPINRQNRELISALETALREADLPLPIYWGNRNWDPYLADAFGRMKADGVQRAIAFFTSMYSCYSGCRQYRENLYVAAAESQATEIHVDKLRMPYNHPLLIDILADELRHQISTLSASERERAKVLFCAHSIPVAMADLCRYQQQLMETGRLTAEQSGVADWELVFQSRSGPPTQPWLEPDVCDRIEALVASDKPSAVIIHPIGFVSDHMEVLFDLDEEAAEACQTANLPFRRARTPSTDPRFVDMIVELIGERLDHERPKRAVGKYGPNHDVCPANCCQSGRPGAKLAPTLAQAPAIIADYPIP